MNINSVNHIIETANKSLSEVLDESGCVLYSSKETLKEGEIYLMGFNPGSSGGPKLKQTIESIRSRTTNAYLEKWDTEFREWEEGKAPFQKRVHHVLNAFGHKTNDVCASNLIFIQSKRSKDISLELANMCWPVHQAIIDVVQPKVIIAIGNGQVSAYRFLHSIMGANSIENNCMANHGSWQVKWFSTKYKGRTISVVGFPHFSYYDPARMAKLNELRTILFE